MIVNGASYRSISYWSKHLQNEKLNVRAEMKEIRGLAAENLRDGLVEMQEMAAFTKCDNFFYQANFSPCSHEKLTDQEWDRAFEIFEKHRGIPEGQARIVFEHEKDDGRVHRHVVWSRIDPETMTAWSDSLDAKICHTASREISEELGLERSISPYDKDREGPRPERAPHSYEMFRGLRSGLDPREVKAQVTGIFRESEHAADFALGLQVHGYQLVQGDRRDFCVLDPTGDVHSLARRLDGVNAKQLRAFMKGFRREDLPTPAQARARLQDVNQQDRQDDLASVQREIAWEESLAKAAIKKEEREKRFVEPTAYEQREADRREKIWPTKPPTSERTVTSPEWHFEEAAEKLTIPKMEPTKGPKLKGTTEHLWDAYHASDTPVAFVNALKEHGIVLAVATKEEADKSYRHSAFARATGDFAPRFGEGEIVAITEAGHIYTLSQRVTGEDRKGVERFLKPLDRKEFLAVEKTKEIMAIRAEERIHEVQAFREILRDTNTAKRWERATKTPPKARQIGGRDKVEKQVERIVSGSVNAISGALKIVDKVADGFTSLIIPTMTPEQVADAKLARHERDADESESIDIRKYEAGRAVERNRETGREVDRGRDR